MPKAMAMKRLCCLVLARLLLLLAPCNGSMLTFSDSSDADASPIRKVITLIEEMKAQVEKEAKDDEIAYNKFKCWCDTEDGRASKQLEENQATIDELKAFLEEGTSKKAQLETQIEQLTADIAEDKDAIASATEVRQKEKASFQAEEADMKETVTALYGAVDVLGKVQLVQKNKKQVKAALIQVEDVIKQHLPKFRSPKYHDVMQKDLYDVLSSLTGSQSKTPPQTGFLSSGSKLVPGRELLPWEKTEEQVGQEGKPNSESGAASGAKSYNARSGQILGLLKEMLDEFSRDLASSQKADFNAEEVFQKLLAAKKAEIAAATAEKKAKETELADLNRKIAQAKEDVATLTEAVGKDAALLADLEKRCKTEAADYEKRVKDRSLELVAIGETLKILTADDARDLYSKTISFVQTRSVRRGQGSESEASAAETQARQERAVQHLANVARKHKDWALASLVVNMRLDKFTKVIEVMDKMHAELKAQQKAEYEKEATCKKDIDSTEDKIWDGNNVKKDLAEKHKQLTNTLTTLTTEIAELKDQVAAAEVSLKQAGEVRKEENQLYQTSVSEQRAVINILQKAMSRLKDFYASEGFLQTKGRPAKAALRKSGWGGAAQPPPEPADYEKSGGAGGVIQLLGKIIGDAKAVEGELVVDENNAQEEYAKIAQDTTDSILEGRRSISDKTKQAADTQGEIAETEESQLANEDELMSLDKLLKAHHAECDFVLKYFDIRQQARQEEMDGIQEAKAILSGAKFD